MVAVLLQLVGRTVVRAAEDGADGDRAGEQGAGLVALHLQALLDADALAVLVGDVLGLAVDELAAGGGQPAGGAAGLDGAEFQQDLVGEGEERVADQDRERRAVHLPHRVAVAALLVAVHQVVVQQREVVDELDGDRAGDADLGRGSRSLGGEQREGGADGLAAVAVRRVALGVDPAEVVRGDGVHGRREPVDRGAEHGGRQRAAALQEGERVRLLDAPSGCAVAGIRVLDSRVPRVHWLSSVSCTCCCGRAGGRHAASCRGCSRWRPSAASAACAALSPLRTAPSMVAGQPVAVHAPAR